MLSLHLAVESDVPIIFDLIKELAEYEHLAHTMKATPGDFHAALFGPEPIARAILARVNGVPVGVGIYYFSLSTFRGKPGLYVEDLYVKPAHRGQGIGKALLAEMARAALARGCDRMEWATLDWNGNARDFYKRLGAGERSEWILYRLEGDPLRTLSRTSK